MNAVKNEAGQPQAIRYSKGARPHFYSESGLDHAMSMIMVLAAEFCVLRDRVDSMERVGKIKGIDFAQEIESLKLDQAALDEREAARQDFLRRLYYLATKEAQELKEADTGERMKQVIETVAKE